MALLWLSLAWLPPTGLGRAPLTQLSTPVLGSKAFEGRGGVGWGTYRPTEIYNGGDPSGMVIHIAWADWGKRRAIGYGLANVFKPDGGYFPRPLRSELQAFDLGHCTARGPSAYERLDVREPSRPGGPLGRWLGWSGGLNLCHPVGA